MKTGINRAHPVNYERCGLKLLPVDFLTGKPAPIEARNWNSNSYEFDPYHLKEGYGVGLIHTASETMALHIYDEANTEYLLGLAGLSLQKLKKHPSAVLIKSKDSDEFELIYKTPQGLTLPSCTIGTEHFGDYEARAEFKCAHSYSSLPGGCAGTNPLRWSGAGAWINLPALPIPLYKLWIFELSTQNKL